MFSYDSKIKFSCVVILLCFFLTDYDNVLTHYFQYGGFIMIPSQYILRKGNVGRITSGAAKKAFVATWNDIGKNKT